MDLTSALIIGTIVVWILYDVYAYAKGGYDNTESAHIKVAVIAHPFLLFVAGFVCGHLFWYNQP